MTDDLDNLEKKIAQFKQADQAEKAEDIEKLRDSNNLNMGLRAGTELVACIAAGTFIGWALDNWLETKPLFLIIFLLAGIGAGFMNVYKITQNIGDSVGFAALHKTKKQAKNAPDNTSR